MKCVAGLHRCVPTQDAHSSGNVSPARICPKVWQTQSLSLPVQASGLPAKSHIIPTLTLLFLMILHTLGPTYIYFPTIMHGPPGLFSAPRGPVHIPPIRMVIRKGTAEDIPAVFELIVELAVYEKAGDQVTNTPAKMLEDGFGPQPVFEFFVAEDQGQIVGMALYYIRYSTWRGRCIYLEDLIVTESRRGTGLGKGLFEAVMAETVRGGYALMTWQVLDWNEPAIRFYKSYGSMIDTEWYTGRLFAPQIREWFEKSPRLS